MDYNGYKILEIDGAFEVYDPSNTLGCVMYSAETLEEAKSIVDYWNRMDAQS